MKTKGIALGTGLILALAYGMAATYVVVNQNIEELVICADEGGLAIPFSASICRSYLFNFRGTSQDVAALQSGTGASFLVQGKSKMDDRERLLTFFTSRGLSLNQMDAHQLTPLHSAVLARAPDEIDMLIRNGADPTIHDKKYGVTPVELARKLQASDPSDQKLSEIISKLEISEGQP